MDLILKYNGNGRIHINESNAFGYVNVVVVVLSVVVREAGGHAQLRPGVQLIYALCKSSEWNW